MKSELYTIKKFKPSELENFYHSDEFRSFQHIPISWNRILSYKNNPRRDDNKAVLYILISNNQVLAYRTVLQDQFSVEHKFVWLSGTWTHPEYRFRGYSKTLLNEILKDYEQKVIVTNYGEEARLLFTKQENLNSFYNLKGKRFYYRLNLKEILPPKSPKLNKLKPFFKLIDKMANPFIDVINKFKINKNLPLQPAKWDENLQDYLNQKSMLFARSNAEFQWILDFPWLYESKSKLNSDSKYHFSTSCERFAYHAYEYREKDGEVLGFLFYVIRNNTIKVHYAFAENDQIYQLFADYLIYEIFTKKVSTLLVTHPQLSDLITKNNGFIYAKSWNKGYISTQEFKKFVENENYNLHLGDGDSIFT